MSCVSVIRDAPWGSHLSCFTLTCHSSCFVLLQSLPCCKFSLPFHDASKGGSNSAWRSLLGRFPHGASCSCYNLLESSSVNCLLLGALATHHGLLKMSKFRKSESSEDSVENAASVIMTHSHRRQPEPFPQNAYSFLLFRFAEKSRRSDLWTAVWW